MKNGIWAKALILGIVVLFIGATVVSSYSVNFINKSNNIDASIIDFIGDRMTNNHDPPPNGEWNNTYGGPFCEQAYSGQQTNDGGYILTGTTKPSDFSDAWLVKVDSNGFELWNKTFGTSGIDIGYSVKQTTDGGYILTGERESSQAWLIKTDAQGGNLWTKIFYGGSEQRGAVGHSVLQTSDGGYVLAGITYTFGWSGLNVLLIKTDSNGNQQWRKELGDVQDSAYSIQPTSDGGFIIAGITQISGWYLDDVLLMKTDSSGNVEWTNKYGGPGGNDWGTSAQQTSDGGYIVCGATESYGAGNGDFWLIKTDSNGTETWNKTYGGNYTDRADDIQQTDDGGYIVGGRTNSYGAGSYDFWLIKTNENGTMQWNITMGGPQKDLGYSVQQTSDGGYMITGQTESFGAGSCDFWLVKFAIDNEPPNAPIITGKTHGKVRVEYQYNFSLSDPDDDSIYLRVDWGNGTLSPWQGPYDFDTIVKINHNWEQKGTYTIRAQAKDIYDAIGNWGILKVTMPVNQQISQQSSNHIIFKMMQSVLLNIRCNTQ